MRLLIVFDDMIGDIKPTKKLIPIVIELFLRGRKPNILLVFKLPKPIRLNAL